MPAFRFFLPLAWSFLLFFSKNSLSQTCQTYHNICIRTGDLIFVGAEQENLSGAINRVTQRENSASFDHVGILEVEESGIYVLHAIGKKGSVREPLDSLILAKAESPRRFALYRLEETYQSAIPEAITQSKLLLGQPYNWSYVLNDSSLYCSDMVERAFRHAQIFTLEPMTFINPETQKPDAFWVDFYKKQNMAVPEGKLGCNPNGLAASDKLQLIGDLKSQ